MIYEIRNYHFDPALFDDYQAWAEKEAIPFLAQKMEVLGFWVNTSDDPEVLGAPLDELGSANVTWIIRWRDLAHRNDVEPALFKSPEWAEIFSRVPGGMDSYKRIEAKFTKSLM